MAEEMSEMAARDEGAAEVRIRHRIRGAATLISGVLLMALQLFIFDRTPPLRSFIHSVMDFGSSYAFSWKIYIFVFFQAIAMAAIILPAPLLLIFLLRKARTIWIPLAVMALLLLSYIFFLTRS